MTVLFLSIVGYLISSMCPSMLDLKNWDTTDAVTWRSRLPILEVSALNAGAASTDTDIS
jgi:hypothetical protein